MRLLLPFLAVALLGAAFSPARLEPAAAPVRWTIRHHDLTATVTVDVPNAHESIANVRGVFPMTVRRLHAESNPRVRIVVGGKALFNRSRTSEEARRLGHLEALHVANNVRGAGERDLAADGTAILQYHASPPGYRIVHAASVDDFGRGLRMTDCDRKGSFEIERIASHAGTTVRVVQRGASFSCIGPRPTAGTIDITSGGRTLYAAHATLSRDGAETPPNAAALLQITGGPVFVDFEKTGVPSIVLTGTSGGVNCCFDMHVYYQITAGAYAHAVHGWGNGASYPVLLRDARSGEVVFGSSNDAFAWFYAAYANAVELVQIVAFERGRFLDVTPDFPDVVRAQADTIWRRARALLRAGKTYEAQPAFGAYVADMVTIGRGPEAWRNVVRACTARECASDLSRIRKSLRELNYRWDPPVARR